MRRFFSFLLVISSFFQVHSSQYTYTPCSATVYILDRVTGRTGLLTMPKGEKIRIGSLLMSMQYAYMGEYPGGRAYSAFIQVWDVASTMRHPLYSSWMRTGCQNLGVPFVHPRYTIWLKECAVQ